MAFISECHTTQYITSLTALYKSDSLGNPILVPYDPMKTDLSDRLKSLTKSLTGNSLSG